MNETGLKQFPLITCVKKPENNSTWSTIVVKSNFFVLFWENWRYQKDVSKLTDHWEWVWQLALTISVQYEDLQIWENILKVQSKSGWADYPPCPPWLRQPWIVLWKNKLWLCLPLHTCPEDLGEGNKCRAWKIWQKNKHRTLNRRFLYSK